MQRRRWALFGGRLIKKTIWGNFSWPAGFVRSGSGTETVFEDIVWWVKAMADRVYIAIDLGASSGRHLAGSFDGKKLVLEELYRFDNGPVPVGDSLHWDVLGLWMHVLQGLRIVRQKFGPTVASIGVDTWGVDFGLLGRGDVLLGNPHHYRDPRTNGVMERAIELVGRETIFRHTGLQFMQFNTLYQLLAMKWSQSPLLEVAQTFLMMPDLFHWLLTGVKSNEFTNATTTQFFDPVKHDWANELLKSLDLPTHIFLPISEPGTKLGRLRPQVVRETGLNGAEVILPGTHDTASAVMAVPAASKPGEQPNWCYISLGTWALMGVEVPRPVITPEVSSFNFTNEGGVGGTIRLLKNITGLWLVQECRRVWHLAGRRWDWEQLNRLSGSARPLVSFIDPDSPEFLAPQDMPQAIREFCRRTGQVVPEDEGAILRCALESIAMKFRFVFERCEKLVGRRIEVIHIVGGGTQNKQLCQAAADACGRPVVAGPVEATAIGNAMMQAVAWGDVSSIAEAREVIRTSFPMDYYEPRNTAAWEDAYERFLKLLQ
ncbi:MAG: rhamnulokinase family protein [Thermoguttaceae bacterium]|nr:rhamnulokinase family protein [Thermoguttaceae bacterium]